MNPRFLHQASQQLGGGPQGLAVDPARVVLSDAGMIVLGNTGIIRGELLFAAVLVVAGVLLYRGDIGLPAKRETTIDSAESAVDTTGSIIAGDADGALPA